MCIENMNTLDDITSIKKEEARYIYEFLIEKNIMKTLEIGLGFGLSAAHIIAATRSSHVAIDPFQKNFKYFGIKNLQKIGFKNNLIFKEDYSHNVLPDLLRDNKKFEFIFIDGSHRFDGIFIDFYYSDLLLEKNGYILFHDTWMRSTQMVLSFIRTNRKDYKFIKTPLRNLDMIQKVGSDNRSWIFYKEFFTLNSIISHNVNIWIRNKNQNLFESLVSKIILKIKRRDDKR